jgi:hypothetical protein
MSQYMGRHTADGTWAITRRDITTLYALYGRPKKIKPHPCAAT